MRTVCNLVVLAFQVISLVLFFSFMVYSIFSFKSRSIFDEGVVTYTHKYLELNEETNTIERGIVSLPEELNDFIAYDFENRKVIISNFGTKEYQCHGSCYCFENERRSTSFALSRSFLLLVASVSSYTVYDVARSHIQGECEERYSNLCLSSLISGEVEECEEVSETNEDEIDNSERRYDSYWCDGNCLHIKFHEEELEKVSDQVECESLKLSSEMKIANAQEEGEKQKEAERLFIQELDGVCQQESTFPVRYSWIAGERETNTKDTYVAFCRGRNGIGDNPTVVCVKS